MSTRHIMNFCTDEEVLQVIKETVLEMKKNGEEIPKNFYVRDEMSAKYRHKFVDHFARCMTDGVLGALDTSFFKNGSEGFAFSCVSLFASEKYLKDVNNQWKPLNQIVFDKLAYVEIYPDDPRFCYLAFKDGHAIKACNEKYNVFLVKILNAILNLYEHKFICLENIKTIEEKSLILHINETNPNYETVNLYYENVDMVYRNLSCTYESKTRLPINLKGYLDKLGEENNHDPDMIATSMIEDGFDQFVYIAYPNNTEKDNSKIFEFIGSAFNDLKLLDYLEFSLLCFVKEFAYGKMDSLEYIIETIIRYFDIEEPSERFKLLTAGSNLFDLMIKNDYPFKEDLSLYKEKFYKLYDMLPISRYEN